MKTIKRIFYSDRALCTARGITIGLGIAFIITQIKKD